MIYSIIAPVMHICKRKNQLYEEVCLICVVNMCVFLWTGSPQVGSSIPVFDKYIVICPVFVGHCCPWGQLYKSVLKVNQIHVLILGLCGARLALYGSAMTQKGKVQLVKLPLCLRSRKVCQQTADGCRFPLGTARIPPTIMQPDVL